MPPIPPPCSTVMSPAEMMRPFLHEFLAAAYEHFDIVIWSATSMRWIELKMRETGVSTSGRFRIAAFLDFGAMITMQVGG
jgi:ubiquitin-like domain-containing CTD phosphatase 1